MATSTLASPCNTDWQGWVDSLDMPSNATVDETEAVTEAVKDALRKLGYKVL